MCLLIIFHLQGPLELFIVLTGMVQYVSSVLLSVSNNRRTFASYVYLCYKFNLQEVAVKILMEQDFHPERFKEFLREVLQ